MHLDHLSGNVHLTYCTNIHAGETWDDIRDSLAAHLPRIKTQVSPDRPFGIGLRLSGIAARDLARPKALAGFRQFLADHNAYVFTLNAFPYGPFHGTRVKEDVYQPDWLTDERRAFTDRTADILAALMPPDQIGSISTVPGTFKPLGTAPGAAEKIALNLARHCAHLVDLERRTGCEIVLAIEPEPACFLETIEETRAFFIDHVFGDAAATLVANRTGVDPEGARALLRRHIGVCYDICHGAVEYEAPADAFAAFEAAGIRIGKLQLSSALRIPQVTAEARALLSRFDDGVYLHQTIERRDGTIIRHTDLAEAFAALEAGQAGGEWRVHCHVPVFLPNIGKFHSTQATLIEALDIVRRRYVAPHLEVETYTWDVLPAELRTGHRADAIARELDWVLVRLDTLDDDLRSQAAE
jgi:sugar phosphate isomerase/epimerase